MATFSILRLALALPEIPAGLEDKLLTEGSPDYPSIMQRLGALFSGNPGVNGGKLVVSIDSSVPASESSGPMPRTGPTITISGDPVADETITIGGVELTWKGTPAAEGEIDIVSGDNTAMAADVAAEINAHSLLKGLVLASSALGVVTLVAANPRMGRLITLAEASTNVAVSAAHLAPPSGPTLAAQTAEVTYKSGVV